MSEAINDGGLAFPYEERDFEGNPHTDHFGMTLRDWFAGQALQGIMAADGPEYTYHNDAESAAGVAFKLADAMLKARAAK